jgi:FkbM family methyltransferase
MTGSRGDSYRMKSLSERIAAALPSGGGLGAVRRRLKPFFARWLAPDGRGLRSVLPGGEVVLVAAALRHITWNPEEYTAFRAAVRPGDVVLEAGANVGAYTMLFAQWAGAAGRVFAFEPDPIAYAGLQQHVALNAVADRVTPVAAAVADGRDQVLRFALGDSSGISRLVQPNEAPAPNTCEVRAISIDQFCAEYRLAPRVIKIDVEGAELAALRGARATVAAAGPRLQLFVEMHPHLWTQLGITTDEIRRECEAQGLVAEKLNGSREDLWQTEGVCLRLRPAGACLAEALAKAGA